MQVLVNLRRGTLCRLQKLVLIDLRLGGSVRLLVLRVHEMRCGWLRLQVLLLLVAPCWLLLVQVGRSARLEFASKAIKAANIIVVRLSFLASSQSSSVLTREHLSARPFWLLLDESAGLGCPRNVCVLLGL